MSRLEEKKIWLVGGSEGIGECLAVMLASTGAHLVLSARNETKLNALVASLPGTGHFSVPLDVTDPESVKKAWAELSRRTTIDTVIYNAGIYDPMSAKDFDPAMIEKTLDVNFRGAVRVLGCVIPDFIKNKYGHIVLVSSIAAYRGLPRTVGYGASKAALYHLAENLKIDLSDCNIKVQVVCPGFVKTRLTENKGFKMPFAMTPEMAADRIIRGMVSSAFEIHFPKRFTLMLKLLRRLPHRVYFFLMDLL